MILRWRSDFALGMQFEHVDLSPLLWRYVPTNTYADEG